MNHDLMNDVSDLACVGRVYGLKVLLVGKPCSGKGTQAPLLARKYRMVHLSTGTLYTSIHMCIPPFPLHPFPLLFLPLSLLLSGNILLASDCQPFFGLCPFL